MITFGLLQNAMGVVFGITIFLSSFLGVTDCWPEGTYGLPMPKNGCPPTQGTFEWKTGSRTHETETGSHGSDPIHLAGIYSTESNKITQSFCMKESYKGEGSWEWEPGQYCIYALNECPAKFKTGWIYWDDSAPYFGDTFQKTTGSLPDGEYDRNTKIHYCCRIDGYITKAIHLPSTAPFYLLKLGDGCQKVDGMQFTEEWVYWADEPTMNLNAHSGTHPKVHRAKYPDKYTRLFYCYYKPKPVNDNMEKALMVLTVMGGIAGGMVFILFLMCLLQRLCKKEYNSPMMPFKNESRNGVVETVTHYTPGREVSLTQAHFEAPPTVGSEASDNELLASVEPPSAMANPVSHNQKILPLTHEAKQLPPHRRLGEPSSTIPSAPSQACSNYVSPSAPEETCPTSKPVPSLLPPPPSSGPPQTLPLLPPSDAELPPPSYDEVMRQDSLSSPDTPT